MEFIWRNRFFFFTEMLDFNNVSHFVSSKNNRRLWKYNFLYILQHMEITENYSSRFLIYPQAHLEKVILRSMRSVLQKRLSYVFYFPGFPFLLEYSRTLNMKISHFFVTMKFEFDIISAAVFKLDSMKIMFLFRKMNNNWRWKLAICYVYLT